MRLSKSTFLLLVSIFIASSCSTTKYNKNNVTRVIKSSTISFSPETDTKQYNNIDISITPIDSKDLDKETFITSLNDGNYSKKFNVDYYIKQYENKNSNLDKKEWKHKKQIIRHLETLVENNELDSKASTELALKIIYPEKGYTGLETNRQEIYPDRFNPFKVNDNYLSVFKIQFSNRSNKVNEINIGDILVNAGLEQLYPLKTSYFNENLKNNQAKLENLYRLNMPDKLILPPNQTVVKYIAIPALNYQEKIAINMIKGEDVVTFQFSPKINIEEKSINFEPYLFTVDKYYNTLNSRSFVLVSDDRVITIKNSKFYVEESIKNKNCSVYGIARFKGGFSFGKLESFQFSNFLSKEVSVKFGENVKYK